MKEITGSGGSASCSLCHYDAMRTKIDMLPLKDRYVFMWQSLEIMNVFSNLILKQVFWRTKKNLKLEYYFLVERTTNESATFPFKTAPSKGNVKTNWIRSKKWTYHKERSFANNYFIFWKLHLSIRTSYKWLV